MDDETNEKAQLRAIQNAFSHLVDQINHHDREVARALRMLDDKINLVSQSMQRYNNPINPDDLTEANLSGGGIAFMVDEALSLFVIMSSCTCNCCPRPTPFMHWPR